MSSNSNSFWSTLLWTTASAVAVGAAAMAVDKALRKRKSNRSLGKSPMQFEDGSKESMVQARFQACVQVMGPQISKLPQQDQLSYYGLFKQATLGDCDEYLPTPPPKYDVVANAKYQAWQKNKGMERVAAMQDYIDKVIQFEYVKSIGGGNEDHDYADDELEGDAVVDVMGMGNNVSTLVGDEDGNMAEDDKQFPLHAAAREGRVEELTTLLASNHDSNLLDPSGQTPLHLAADRGHVDCVKKLIVSGANLHAVDHDGISVLQAAVIGGDVESCKLLLALGCDPHQADHDGDTPAHSAKDDKELDKIFISHEKNPLQLKGVDAGFLNEMDKAGITLPKEQQPMNAQEEMKKLDQPIAFDFDDDGDM